MNDLKNNTETSKEFQENLRVNLLNAAADIEQYGWTTTPIGSDAWDEAPSCVWIAFTKVIDRDRETHWSAGYRYNDAAYLSAGQQAILRAAGVSFIGRLFDKNDSHTNTEEGQAWASRVLKDASLLIANARFSDKTVIDWTPSTDSGNTRSVVSRVKVLLKKLHLVK